MPDVAEAPVRQANTENRYDRSVTAQVNAKDDAGAISADLTAGRSEEALKRFQQETSDRGLLGASQQQRTEYMSALTDQLTRDGVLPALQIAAVQREGDAVKKPGGEIDLAKINERAAALKDKDPIASMLLSGYAREQQALQRAGAGGITDAGLQMQLDRQVGSARELARDKQVRDGVSPLVSDPKLFDAMAGLGRGVKDGRIEQKDMDAFRAQWGDGTKPEHKAFRAQFGTQEQQNRIDKFLKDNPKVDTPENRRLGLIESNLWTDNAFTKQTLTKGLGGEQAVQRIQQQSEQRPNGTVPREVAPASPETSTLRAGEGPHQIAKRMLQGGEFADPAKAQRDLQAALGRNFIDKAGTNQLDGANRDKIREDIRKSDNTELLKWFDRRYPGKDETARPEAPAAMNQDAKDKQGRDAVSPLVSDPKLFDAMAGLGRGVKDGRIEQKDLDAFRTQWGDGTKPEHKAFRAQFGTQEQQNRIDKFLKDNPKVDTPENRRLGLIESNAWYGADNAFTRQTLEKGLGGEQAVRNYQQEAQRRPDGKLPKDVPPAGPETSTLRSGEGPHQVARRMLQGSEFADPAKAQRDLQAALGRNFIDKAGTNQLDGANRDKVREDIRNSNNTELLNWFDKRYPQPKPAESTRVVEAPKPAAQADYSSTRVIAGRGADAVSRQMLSGSGLDENARAALQGVLQSKELGIDWKSVQAGKPVIGDAEKPGLVDVEKFRGQVEKTGNEALKAWFKSKFPEKKAAAAIPVVPIESTWIMAP